MEFKLNKSQKEIQKAARAFAKGEFDKEQSLEFNKNREYPLKIWKKAADLGFIGIHFDEQYSGGGLGLLENVLLAEELCRRDSSMGCALLLSSYGSECLLRFSSTALKQKFLPAIAEGRMLSAAALKEHANDYNITGIAATAVVQDDEYIINGVKPYVINAGNAGCYLVLCRTDPDLDLKQALSLIVVEGDRAGLEVDKISYKMGLNLINTGTVKFTDVHVPCTNLIGTQGQGLQYAQHFCNESRLNIAGLALGMAQGALDRAIDYVKQRVQFGKKLGQFQSTQHKIAVMSTKIQMARLMVYEAAWNYDHKNQDANLAAMAKLTCARAAVEVTDETVQLMGGYGYMTEYEVESYFRNAKLMEILEGNQEILKDQIAGHVIGRIK